MRFEREWSKNTLKMASSPEFCLIGRQKKHFRYSDSTSKMHSENIDIQTHTNYIQVATISLCIDVIQPESI